MWNTFGLASHLICLLLLCPTFAEAFQTQIFLSSGLALSSAQKPQYRWVEYTSRAFGWAVKGNTVNFWNNLGCTFSLAHGSSVEITGFVWEMMLGNIGPQPLPWLHAARSLHDPPLDVEYYSAVTNYSVCVLWKVCSMARFQTSLLL